MPKGVGEGIYPSSEARGRDTNPIDKSGRGTRAAIEFR